MKDLLHKSTASLQPFATVNAVGHGALILKRLTDEPRFDALADKSANLNAAAWPDPAVSPRPQLPRQRSGGSRLYRKFGKRCLDVFLALMSLPVTLPVMIICAFALAIEGGNPFYTQERLGRNGKRFRILKLRTMVRDADARLDACLAQDPALRREWDATQKLKNDPRITKVGRFLRVTSLDELPQLLNVAKGEMSLVGPRPMMPEQLPLYGNPQDYFDLEPGLTGLW